jgi:hypothetical protein
MEENPATTISDIAEAFSAARELFEIYRYKFHGAWPCRVVLIHRESAERLSPDVLDVIATISVSPNVMTLHLDPIDGGSGSFKVNADVEDYTPADIAILEPDGDEILHRVMMELKLNVRAHDIVALLAHVPKL